MTNMHMCIHIMNKKLEEIFLTKAMLYPRYYPDIGFVVDDKKAQLKVIVYDRMSGPNVFEHIEARGWMETAYFRRGGKIQ